MFILTSVLIQCKDENTTSDFDKFTGRWKLYKIQLQDTLTQNWSDATGNNKNRKGFIIYDGLGGMGVHHVSENYENYEFERKGTLDSLTKKDLRHLANNFVYFGTYKVLENEKFIEHHIESYSNPNAWGKIAKRGYEFKGDTLILLPLSSGSGQQARIIWLKLNDKTD